MRPCGSTPRPWNSKMSCIDTTFACMPTISETCVTRLRAILQARQMNQEVDTRRDLFTNSADRQVDGYEDPRATHTSEGHSAQIEKSHRNTSRIP